MGRLEKKTEGQTMKESSKIYGQYFDETKLANMNYIEALEYKNKCAQNVLDELFKEPYSKNHDLINDVSKAIKFNQTLIDLATKVCKNHNINPEYC